MRRRGRAALLPVALLVPGCALLGGGGGGGIELTAYFPKAVALYAQSQVRVLGLPAGSVKEIETEGDRVRVLMQLDDDVPVPADVQAAIIPNSLIGERYVQLFPAWTEGQPQAEDGAVIDLDRTIIPVEPDEALAALKEFLDTLDPEGVGRLIDNAAGTLEGNGEHVNRALASFSELVETFAENDDVIVSILENFDDFTATMLTREQQLGEIMDAFATATGVLADERADLEGLINGLAQVSNDGLDLVAEHATRLEQDIATLTRLARSVDTQLGAVEDLLDAGPVLTAGLLDAYNPQFHAINLRNSFSPVAQQVLDPLFDELGVDLPSVCVPVDVECQDEQAEGQAQPAPQTQPGQVTAQTTSEPTPVDDIAALLGSRRTATADAEREPSPSPSLAERIADGAGAMGGFLQGAGKSLLGVVS
ncbi:MAG: MCE family protein [Actinomycetota bacterium]